MQQELDYERCEARGFSANKRSEGDIDQAREIWSTMKPAHQALLRTEAESPPQDNVVKKP
ncbi:MAG: hypothetical protein NTW08_07470 [Gammaproteobacteria bacterium]|nr:hypothetical protein [Gammaproteobacteria bacterium]